MSALRRARPRLAFLCGEFPGWVAPGAPAPGSREIAHREKKGGCLTPPPPSTQRLDLLEPGVQREAHRAEGPARL